MIPPQHGGREVIIRPRPRQGIWPLQWQLLPSIAEWRIDKLKVNIRGRVHVPAAAHPAWHARIFRGEGASPVWFFTDHGGPGRTRVAKFKKKELTIRGRLTVVPSSAGDDDHLITFSLNLNPTRTFAHLGCPALSTAEALPPAQFFASDAARGKVLRSISLDRGDNISLDDAPIGRALDGRGGMRWLEIYEQKLRALCEWILFAGADHPASEPPADSDGVTGHLDWHTISVPQVEAYLERYTAHAVGRSHGVAQCLLATSRELRVDAFPVHENHSVGRSSAAMSAAIPLTKTATLVTYPKTQERVRFEVRYANHSILTRTELEALQQSMGTGGPLSVLLGAYCHDAMKRLQLPWQSLTVGLAANEEDVAGCLADLANAVRVACAPDEDQFTSIFAWLLRDGSLPLEQASIQPVVQALLEAGVLLRYRMLLREAPGAKRQCALNPRYLAACAEAGFGLIETSASAPS